MILPAKHAKVREKKSFFFSRPFACFAGPVSAIDQHPPYRSGFCLYVNPRSRNLPPFPKRQQNLAKEEMLVLTHPLKLVAI